MVSTGTSAGEFVLLGKITKPHGIRGEVKVYPFSSQPENFLNYEEFFISSENSEQRVPCKVDKIRVQAKQVLMQFANCTTRTEAESLVGSQVWIRRQELPELEKNEFYLLDLEGKMVVTTDGLELGQVTGVLDTAAHEILCITGEHHEYLVPVEKSFIVHIGDDKVVLNVPPGLLEINRK